MRFLWFVRRTVFAGVLVGVVVFAASVLPASATRSVASARGSLHVSGVPNLLDCNVTVLKRLCTDPHGKPYDGYVGRFRDPKSGAYVGHDEPSVKFISSRPGSGNTMTYQMQLPRDPAKAPTASGSVTTYGELSVAPWFGLPICDPNSYPVKRCKPLSDKNTGLGARSDAGSAFMELQFYPPGFTPFIDSTSCSATQWCSALTIDSLECSFNFRSCNNNCIEPVNFAFLQTNGIPAGPPAPQDPNTATLLGNGKTLRMNPGDVLRVSIRDVADSGSPDRGGLLASVTDVTTGRTGYIVASAKNGFQNTSMADCSGTPHSFHAEYSTAKKANQVPWAALEGGVLMEQEIGHGEACSTLSHRLGFSSTYADGSSYVDPNVFQTCNGGLEGRNAKGEGPCNPLTAICQHATTQGRDGPVACPTNDASSGALCEFSDGTCVPKGTRPVTINGRSTTESARLNYCFQGAFQNGDLDFDGTDYRPDWPNGSTNFPTSIRYTGPLTNGHSYPNLQFETDVAASEALCDTSTGTDCTAPPLSAQFYPFWTLTSKQTIPGSPNTGCIWNFGNTNPEVTTNNLGKDTQYGTPNIARYAGTLTSPVIANPALAPNCGAP